MRRFPNGLMRGQLATSSTSCRLRPVAFRTVPRITAVLLQSVLRGLRTLVPLNHTIASSAAVHPAGRVGCRSRGTGSALAKLRPSLRDR
jgi:hypothetical protein